MSTLFCTETTLSCRVRRLGGWVGSPRSTPRWRCCRCKQHAPLVGRPPNFKPSCGLRLHPLGSGHQHCCPGSRSAGHGTAPPPGILPACPPHLVPPRRTPLHPPNPRPGAQQRAQGGRRHPACLGLLPRLRPRHSGQRGCRPRQRAARAGCGGRAGGGAAIRCGLGGEAERQPGRACPAAQVGCRWRRPLAGAPRCKALQAGAGCSAGGAGLSLSCRALLQGSSEGLHHCVPTPLACPSPVRPPLCTPTRPCSKPGTALAAAAAARGTMAAPAAADRGRGGGSGAASEDEEEASQASVLFD